MTTGKAKPGGSPTAPKPLSAAESLRPDYSAEQLAAAAAWEESRRERVFDAAVSLAIADEAFRKRLAAKLKGLGEQRPRRATPAVEFQHVATATELLWRNFAGTRRDAHRLKTPRLFSEIARIVGISPTQARDRYYKAKKLGLLDFMQDGFRPL